jgi:hypothetical protein
MAVGLRGVKLRNSLLIAYTLTITRSNLTRSNLTRSNLPFKAAKKPRFFLSRT